MNVLVADFCGFERCGRDAEWRQLQEVLSGVPLYVKESDQAGRGGSLIFDPVGTNGHIKSALQDLGWGTNISIPSQHSALGTDVDYGVNGVLAEGQFSNYPFFLNNVLRANFFYRKRVVFDHIGHVGASIIVTKAHALPASNSTLYYEQALKQMTFILEAVALSVPMRLVGLTVDIGIPLRATYSTYNAPRYSRTVAARTTIRCELQKGTRAKSRCRIVRL